MTPCEHLKTEMQTKKLMQTLGKQVGAEWTEWKSYVVFFTEFLQLSAKPSQSAASRWLG